MHGLEYINNENHHAKLRGRIFRRFWVKEPRHSENISAKKVVYLYRRVKSSIQVTARHNTPPRPWCSVSKGMRGERTNDLYGKAIS